ncbi:cell division protein ZapE [Rhodococcus sp. NPDC058514]|uniref:cell division protein ZapE n=1 Tax=unclassified Rhodococcus (in: high G+C Gram-positive bacteria) TaxID=192944 RepID=UPI00364F1199
MESTRMDAFDRAACDAGFVLDPAQRAAAERLAALDLAAGRGVYLWGPVGRGKTWLMDVFRDGLGEVATRRVHFHDFFRRLHTLAHSDGIERAMDLMLDRCEILFFDEFHVHDVGDGALLTRLLGALRERGATLVVTSNYPPDGLMPNPLFHETFVPTIEVLKERMEIVEVSGAVDYRGPGTGARRFGAGRYLPDAAALKWPTAGDRVTLRPTTQPITALSAAGDLVWFEFADLCERPTSTLDYLSLAAAFPRWVLSGMPQIIDASPDGVQRFCNVVDILHDQDTELTVVGADWRASGPEPVAGGLDLARTRSRLALLG